MQYSEFLPRWIYSAWEESRIFITLSSLLFRALSDYLKEAKNVREIPTYRHSVELITSSRWLRKAVEEMVWDRATLPWLSERYCMGSRRGRRRPVKVRR